MVSWPWIRPNVAGTNNIDPVTCVTRNVWLIARFCCLISSLTVRDVRCFCVASVCFVSERDSVQILLRICVAMWMHPDHRLKSKTALMTCGMVKYWGKANDAEAILTRVYEVVNYARPLTGWQFCQQYHHRYADYFVHDWIIDRVPARGCQYGNECPNTRPDLCVNASEQSTKYCLYVCIHERDADNGCHLPRINR